MIRLRNHPENQEAVDVKGKKTTIKKNGLSSRKQALYKGQLSWPSGFLHWPINSRQCLNQGSNNAQGRTLETPTSVPGSLGAHCSLKKSVDLFELLSPGKLQQ